MFTASAEKFANNNCLGHRASDSTGYTWLTYRQTAEQSAEIGSALVKVGLEPHGRVGVYGANSPEWMIAMQVGAAAAAGAGAAEWAAAVPPSQHAAVQLQP
jgi:long-chain acyl-CoA synthetase